MGISHGTDGMKTERQRTKDGLLTYNQLNYTRDFYPERVLDKQRTKLETITHLPGRSELGLVNELSKDDWASSSRPRIALNSSWSPLALCRHIRISDGRILTLPLSPATNK